MRLLLDTRVLLWLLNGDQMTTDAKVALGDPTSTLFVSVVSLWEIVIKSRSGKLKVDIGSINAQFSPRSKLQWLGLTPDHLQALSVLPIPEQHKDPFDHLLIAQAIADQMTLVTRDRHVPLYPVSVLVA